MKKSDNQHSSTSKESVKNGYTKMKDSDMRDFIDDSDIMTEPEIEEDDISTEPMAESESVNDQEQWRDKYIRLSAEFDNYRKRTIKEKSELITLGGEGVVKAILPVLDDIDRALEVMETSDDVVSLREGIELVSHKLHDMLKAQGLEEIEAIGEELDTDFHEAIAIIAAEKKSLRGKIVDIAQKGYSFKDKVIRHAKVVVGK